MRHSKFKPVLESMEPRLTLSDVTPIMTPPPTPTTTSGFVVPGQVVKVVREGPSRIHSEDWMDFSNLDVPDNFTYYCHKPTDGSDIFLETD